MPANVIKGGITPQDPNKPSTTTSQGPQVLKGGMVPSEVLEDSLKKSPGSAQQVGDSTLVDQSAARSSTSDPSGSQPREVEAGRGDVPMAADPPRPTVSMSEASTPELVSADSAGPEGRYPLPQDVSPTPQDDSEAPKDASVRPLEVTQDQATAQTTTTQKPIPPRR